MAEFSLPRDQFPRLGVLWPGDRNALSPLYPYGTPEERNEVNEVLKGLSVLDQNGGIEVRFHHILSVLDDPERCVSIDIMTYGGMKSLETYFGTDKVSAVSLLYGESGNVYIRENTGREDFFSSGDFDGPVNNELDPADIELTHQEAWIAAALFDGERRSANDAITHAVTTNELVLEPAVHDPLSIQRTFAFSEQKPEENFFLNLLEGMGGTDRTDVDLVGIGGHLQSLQVKGLIRQTGSGYTLPDRMLPMIRRTLIADRMTSIRTGRIDSAGKELAESALCIRADGSLLWFIAANTHPDRILLKYLSAEHEKTILTNVLDNPDYSLSGMTVPVHTAHLAEKHFCSQCGSRIGAGKKFCSVCGVRI
jgi:hypothetical protein